MKALVVYYSATGNTQSVAETFDKEMFDVIPVRELDYDKLNDYKHIVIGMSTWERGMPPKVFQRNINHFKKLKDKKFYFFGSGRSEYEYFCGALDLYYEILKQQNEVTEPMKFEGYPSEKNWHYIKEWQENIINDIKGE